MSRHVVQDSIKYVGDSDERLGSIDEAEMRFEKNNATVKSNLF